MEGSPPRGKAPHSPEPARRLGWHIGCTDVGWMRRTGWSAKAYERADEATRLLDRDPIKFRQQRPLKDAESLIGSTEKRP
jgi:hypothetical protein